jgi:outer membrane protein assembly factor BamB
MQRRNVLRNVLITVIGMVVCCVISPASRGADPEQGTSHDTDWPQFRGPRGDGTWHGPSLSESWPATGLKRVWKQSIGGGYAGISVADGRAITMDRQTDPEIERVLCFDAATGTLLWQHNYPVTYGKLDYGNGPRAAPTIHGGHVYTVGALGDLRCLDAVTGKVVWTRNYLSDYGGRLSMWGFAASPVVHGDWLIVQPGGDQGSSVVAIERATGTEVWRSLNDEAGYSTPVIHRAHGLDQLICWTPSHIRCLDVKTGNLLWSHPYEITYGVSIAKPIVQERIVLVAGYWHGTKAIRLGDSPTTAKLLWEENRYLRGLMSQPLYRNGYVYLLDKQYGLTCFELQTGKKLWDDKNQMTPRGRNPHASLVWLGDSDRAIILNEEGELILARLNPDGYREQSRTKITDFTWAHPALAGNHVFARTDKELVCVSLEEARSR